MTIEDMQNYKNTAESIATARKYADIIHLSRPVSGRVKMDHVQRAKIFAPFDALRGFDAEIDIAQDYGREVARIELSEEQESDLSHKLSDIRKGMRVTAQYFIPGLDKNVGNYVTSSGIVTRIDPLERVLEIQQAGARERVPDIHEYAFTAAAAGGRLEKTLPTVIGFDDLLDINISINQTGAVCGSHSSAQAF